MTLLSRSARREHPILDVVDPSAGAASSLFSRGSLLTSTSGHFPASAEEGAVLPETTESRKAGNVSAPTPLENTSESVGFIDEKPWV